MILYSPAPEAVAPAMTRTRSALQSTSLVPVSVSNISEGVSNKSVLHVLPLTREFFIHLRLSCNITISRIDECHYNLPNIFTDVIFFSADFTYEKVFCQWFISVSTVNIFLFRCLSKDTVSISSVHRYTYSTCIY